AGFLRGQADLLVFDYLDRLHPLAESSPSDRWGRGKFPAAVVGKPPQFDAMPRRFRRYGLERRLFQQFLMNEGPFDFALVQTVMTYWYTGVKEVLEDLRPLSPTTRIILGGVYATLCPDHARSLGAALVISGARLDDLWHFLGMTPDPAALPFWEGYAKLKVGVLKLAYGCPFRCTYCSVPLVQPTFHGYPMERSLAEADFLRRLGVTNVAFYDDALLYRPEKTLL